MSVLHPDYGLPDETRIAAVRSAELLGVKPAADLHRVSVHSIYKWRKIFWAKIERAEHD